MAKKKSSGEALLVGVAIVIGLLASIPKELWIGIGVLVVVAFVARAFLKKSEPDVPQASYRVTVEATSPPSADAARSKGREERSRQAISGKQGRAGLAIGGFREPSVLQGQEETDIARAWVERAHECDDQQRPEGRAGCEGKASRRHQDRRKREQAAVVKAMPPCSNGKCRQSRS